MGYLNQTKRITDSAHLNWMAGPSYNIKDPILNLRLAASSSLFGEPMYYPQDSTDKRPKKQSDRPRPQRRLSPSEVDHLRSTLDAIDPQEWRGMSPKELMESAIDAALSYNVEATLLEAVRLRNEDHIRVTPQVILVRAANTDLARGSGLVRKYAPNIILRADEPATGFAYQKNEYGRPIPNNLKKAWRDALMKFDDYQLAKYRLDNHETKTRDVVRMVHPCSPVVTKLMLDELKNTRTWEAIISREGSTKAAWTKALDVMNHMGLLKNLRNLLEAGVEPDLFLDKLIEGVPYGKQLPFRYYSAYEAVKTIAPPSVLDGLEECLKASLGNLPHFQGRVMSLCDNSGSAWGTTTSAMGTMHIAQIGNLTGVVTGQVSDEGYLGIFGDRLETRPVRKSSSVFDMLAEANKAGLNIGGSTENGIWLFWDKAIREQEHWDSVFIYSDMQAGHGMLYGIDPRDYADFTWQDDGSYTRKYIDIPKLINKYRSRVNPDVNVFLVQIAGYQDTIVPEFYKRTYILGGWGPGLLNFAGSMIPRGRAQ